MEAESALFLKILNACGTFRGERKVHGWIKSRSDVFGGGILKAAELEFDMQPQRYADESVYLRMQYLYRSGISGKMASCQLKALQVRWTRLVLFVALFAFRDHSACE
jgi:hypothetical protein